MRELATLRFLMLILFLAPREIDAIRAKSPTDFEIRCIVSPQESSKTNGRGRFHRLPAIVRRENLCLDCDHGVKIEL